MEYEIYRTIKIGDGQYQDSLMAITFTEENAHELVKAIRKSIGNQLCYFKEVK